MMNVEVTEKGNTQQQRAEQTKKGRKSSTIATGSLRPRLLLGVWPEDVSLKRTITRQP